jgi:hypothetical protein
MDREESFEKFLKECKNRGEWSGQGNPNADILIIGKEPHNDALITDKEEIKRRLKRQEEICRNGFGEAPRDRKKPTWYNYQILIENIYGPKGDFNPELFDFEKFAFTTELNTILRPKADFDAETRNNISKRLQFFKNSKFINSFPVIVLACNDFISNDEPRGFLINNTFGVKYDGDSSGKHQYSRGHWFYTHHSDNEEKLVIHTRQLSFLFDKNFLPRLAEEIRAHLKKHGLIQ